MIRAATVLVLLVACTREEPQILFVEPGPKTPSLLGRITVATP